MCGLWLRDLRTVKQQIHLSALSPRSKLCRAEPNLLCTSHIWVLTRWWGWELLPGESLTHGLEGAEDLLTFQTAAHGIFSPFFSEFLSLLLSSGSTGIPHGGEFLIMAPWWCYVTPKPRCDAAAAALDVFEDF